MPIPIHLIEHLHQLAASVDADDPAVLAKLLEELAAYLQAAVSGHAGLALTVVHTGQPVTLTAVEPDLTAVATSLRLPLRALAPSYEEGSQLLLYSTVPGALVDLAADLGYVLGAGDHPELEPVLDADLPPATTTSGVTGLAELATISRATGVLIDRGHDPDTILDLLTRQALAAGVAVHVIAAELLR